MVVKLKMDVFFNRRWWHIGKIKLKFEGIKQKFDSEPVYNKIFMKTKTKFYSDEATIFHNKKFLR